MLDASMATLVDDGLLVGMDEYAAARRGLMTLESPADHDDDAEFAAILRMKSEPLILTQPRLRPMGVCGNGALSLRGRQHNQADSC
jgi:hypothetical protein